jgi:hypothetical protein
MRFTTTSVFAALAAITSAAFTPVGSDPTGNPIGHPELGELMTAGESFTITWTPTTQGASTFVLLPRYLLTYHAGNISLILLQGPSSNVIPIMTIVDSTVNNGSYTFEVPTSLAPAATGYGIELIDASGAFQYSPQCGVANSEFSGSSSTASGNYITMTLSTGANYTGPTASPTTFTAATGNATILTASLTLPSTLQSTVVVTPTQSFFSATPSVAQATQTATGGAIAMNAGMGFAGLAGLVAAFVL